MTHRAFSWPQRVYFQHTDAGGMVFHAHYLSFMECARTEFLASVGFDLRDLAQRQHVLFVVHSAKITFHRPGMLNDLLSVTAKLSRVGRARLEFEQSVRRGEQVLVSASLTFACVDARSHKLIVLPEAIRKTLQEAS